MVRKKISLKTCLEFLPLRISVTDYCNLRCFFCSNEGMPLCRKNKKHINLKQLKYLVRILADEGLKNLSITGGEPTLYPHIIELVDFLNQFNFKNLFLHTNGTNLDRSLLKKLSLRFNKIAISVHSFNFNIWQKITSGTERQFRKIMDNLQILTEFNDAFLVELKCVPIRGYNDSEKEFKTFLDFCNVSAFKFKFLNFEPIIDKHIELVIPFSEIEEKLFDIGCRQAGQAKKTFRGQNNYLPIREFKYKNVSGVAIEIGCGDPSVCKECYRSSEIFITPELEIKPCHMNNYQINLVNLIKQKNRQNIFQNIIDSRLFLAESPGAGLEKWQN